MSSAALWRSFTSDRTHTRSTDTPNPQHTYRHATHTFAPPLPAIQLQLHQRLGLLWITLQTPHHAGQCAPDQILQNISGPPQQSLWAASTADPVHMYCLPPLFSPHGSPHFSWEPMDGGSWAAVCRLWQTNTALSYSSFSLLSSQCRAGLV